MTRPQIRAYFYYLNRRKRNELEQQAVIIWAPWGYDPTQNKRSAKQKEIAEKWQSDPLYGFPDDIIYFDRQQIEQKIAVSVKFGSKMLPEAKWDKQRGYACNGHYGTVARRCSMNDRLWGIYQEARRKTVMLTLEQIKRMILIDIKRSKLYPPGWTDATANPPGWYLDKLRNEGSLDRILKEIDEIARA